MAYTTIDDPSAYFHTQLYTGNGTAIGSGGNAITNNANSGNFKPDWTWHKVRSTTNDHQIYDSSRGVKIRLNPNATNADFTLNEGLQSFDTNGFTVGSDNGVNQNSQTFVAWQWKANGGTTTTNDASSTGVGNLDSVYQANTDAGFSIVTYSGAGGNNLVAHGLGVTPDLMIQKRRNNGNENDGRWVVWHKSLAALHNPESFLFLHLNNSRSEDQSVFGAGASTGPNSTTFRIGSDSLINGSGGNHIMYCFAEKQGYSKFGSYTGNQSTDGPFLYFGFKPAFLMVKKTTSAENWFLIDNKRHPFNDGQIPRVIPNNTDAESEDASIAGDFLSNGFKIRATQNMINESGTYIYMAFAESPFVSSEGVPTTAR